MSANITICTPLRDAAGLIDSYRRQVAELKWPVDRLRLVLCEGDSVDDTAAQAAAWAAWDSRVRVVTCNTGRPHYPSMVHPERFAILAQVFNAALAAVDLAWSEYVLFLPVDIRYDPDLLRRLAAHDADIVAPLVFQDGVFYDIWAFSRDGVDLPAFHHTQAAELYGCALLRMTTVGGTVLIRAEVLRAGVRYAPVNVDRGFCEAARAAGFGVWCDPATWVVHPRR